MTLAPARVIASLAVGALVGAALGHRFLLRGDGWRDFWHRTLATFRLRPAE